MNSYWVLANDSIEFTGRHFSKFPGRIHFLGFGCSKLKVAHPVNYFLGFLGTELIIAHPVNYSYLPPCMIFKKRNCWLFIYLSIWNFHDEARKVESLSVSSYKSANCILQRQQWVDDISHKVGLVSGNHHGSGSFQHDIHTVKLGLRKNILLSQLGQGKSYRVLTGPRCKNVALRIFTVCKLLTCLWVASRTLSIFPLRGNTP